MGYGGGERDDQTWLRSRLLVPPGWADSTDSATADFRNPLTDNVLYRNLGASGPGVTEFLVYDNCTSTDKEIDADGRGQV